MRVCTVEPDSPSTQVFLFWKVLPDFPFAPHFLTFMSSCPCARGVIVRTQQSCSHIDLDGNVWALLPFRSTNTTHLVYERAQSVWEASTFSHFSCAASVSWEVVQMPVAARHVGGSGEMPLCAAPSGHHYNSCHHCSGCVQPGEILHTGCQEKTHTHTHIYIYMCIHIYMCVCVCMYIIFMYVCVSIHRHTHTSINI